MLIKKLQRKWANKGPAEAPQLFYLVFLCVFLSLFLLELLMEEIINLFTLLITAAITVKCLCKIQHSLKCGINVHSCRKRSVINLSICISGEGST